MCYIVYFVIYGMVVFAHPTDPAVQALLFLSPENGGETVRAFPAVLAVVPGMGSASLAPSPFRAVPAWPCPMPQALGEPEHMGWDGDCWGRRSLLPYLSPTCLRFSIYLRRTMEGCPSPSAPSLWRTHPSLVQSSRASYT